MAITVKAGPAPEQDGDAEQHQRDRVPGRDGQRRPEGGAVDAQGKGPGPGLPARMTTTPSGDASGLAAVASLTVGLDALVVSTALAAIRITPGASVLEDNRSVLSAE